MAWQDLPVEVRPVLPGTVPVLHWFADERGFVGRDPWRRDCYTAPMNWLDDVKWDAQGLVAGDRAGASAAATC